MKLLSDYTLAIKCYSLLGTLSIRSKVDYCSICEKERHFGPFGIKLRKGAMCMNCKSVERHRILYEILKEEQLLTKEKNLLYFSPDPCLEVFFRETALVKTCDYGGGSHVDLPIDMTKIALPDASFHVVVALHVLEHIPDDGEALREVYRILDKGGTFVVMIPQTMDRITTIEDEIKNPITRAIKYGQHDHVRSYGLDFTSRAKEVGFHVKVFGNSSLEGKMLNDEFRETDFEDQVYFLTKK